MEKMLDRLAKQLAALDEASLMSLWDKYYERVKRFEPTQQWERGVLILGMLQTVRWKNQLFNLNWRAQRSSPQGSEGNVPATTEHKQDLSESAKKGESQETRGKVIHFQPRKTEDPE